MPLLLRLPVWFRHGLLLIALTCPGLSQPFIAGQTYFGRNNYIEYRAGNLPLILTAGHGGDLVPSEIPDRTTGTTVTDTNTEELAVAIANAMFTRTGLRPHLIICHLKRTKLDANREIIEAAQGNVFAEQAWTEYRDFILAARSAAESAFGFGFLVDIHGHGHTVQRLELGYGYGATELNLSDAALESPGYAWMGTLRTTALRRPGVPFSTLLRGNRSFGDIMNLRGFPSWPSPDFPAPGAEPFFNGGYTVQTHTCLTDNGAINGVQIESNFTGVRDSSQNRANFAEAFLRVLQPYLYDNYGYSIGALSLTAITPPSTTVLTRGGPALTVTVNRTGFLGVNTTIALSFSGNATRNTDYTASATSVAFAANQASATFTLTPAAASPVFGDKSLIVTLNPSNTQSVNPAPLTLTLGDGLSQAIRSAVLTPSVSEAAGPARFRLTRTQSTASLTVPLTWSGTALANAEYFNAPASATFAPGIASFDLDVPLVNDGRPAPDRTLVLTPGAVAGAVTGLPASASATLLDDDRPAGLAAWLRGDLSGNVALDSSGLARHATTLPANSALATGPTAITVPAAANAPAIAFDGVNDTLALPRFTVDPAGAFTLAFSFRFDAGGAIVDQNLASYGSRAAAGSVHVYLLTTNSGNGTVALRTNLPSLSTSALDVSRTSPSSWQDGVWRHYALSVAADGSARVYLDGVLQRTATGRTGSLAANELFWFGWQPTEGDPVEFMKGALRDIRVYQRALPAAEITTLVNGRLTFSAWLTLNNLAPALAATADPDGDGLSALLEYALAASPAVSAAAPRYELGVASGRLTLSFLRETAAGDLTWTVEATNDLATTWTPIARRTPTDTTWTILTVGAAAVESNGQVVITDSTVLATQPRRFLRLRAETTP
jgi:hypothetical protein